MSRKAATALAAMAILACAPAASPTGEGDSPSPTRKRSAKQRKPISVEAVDISPAVLPIPHDPSHIEVREHRKPRRTKAQARKARAKLWRRK